MTTKKNLVKTMLMSILTAGTMMSFTAWKMICFRSYCILKPRSSESTGA